MDFLQTVKQIGIFMICAQAILHFKPSAKYEKYLKLLVSVMVLVQLLMPLLEFVTGNNRAAFFDRLEEIQAGIEAEMEQLDIENAINEENILKETKQEIINRINEIARTMDLRVSSIEFYETYLAVYVEEKSLDVVNIEKVEVDEIAIREVREVMGDAIRSSMEDSCENARTGKEKLQVLRYEISTMLGIEESRIEVLEDV